MGAGLLKLVYSEERVNSLILKDMMAKQLVFGIRPKDETFIANKIDFQNADLLVLFIG